LPEPPARVHFVGIGGIGMSGLARIFLARGYEVSGSDAVSSDQTDALESIGIPVSIGHTDTARAARADLVVATAAAPSTNPELVEARQANRMVVKRAAALGALANARLCIAVAGSHGKSTTSGMVTTALLALGYDPSYAVGAIVSASGVNASPGRGEEMVVEADEYDYSFLTLTPDIAIVTNVEFDHPDLFPDQAAYDEAFCRFIRQIRPGGTLVMSVDDPGCKRLTPNPLFVWPEHLHWFGESNQANWQLRPSGRQWKVKTPDGEIVSLNIKVPGRHNAMNALASMVALSALGIPAADAAEALGTFTGVGRRFELKGEAAGVTVIDEYSHHPTEVRASLLAARQRYPDRRIWAVFQPHTYSRTKTFLDEWPGGFVSADRVMLLDVYPSRETDDLGVSSDDIARRMPGNVLRAATPADAADQLARQVENGDVVITLGAGDITKAGPMLLALLNGTRS
jgi:UDP-N-acetylmuramate--alanine ligase